MAYTLESKNTTQIPQTDIVAGVPIGLLLTLTYAEAITSQVDGFNLETKNSTSNYSLETKNST